MLEHWSDCAVHNEPFMPAGPCDCGGLYLTDDLLHGGVPSLVPVSGRPGWLVTHMGRDAFVNAHDLPSDGLVAGAAAACLPDAHDADAGLVVADGMDLNAAAVPVVANL
jgi:hypothetical protein